MEIPEKGHYLPRNVNDFRDTLYAEIEENADGIEKFMSSKRSRSIASADK